MTTMVTTSYSYERLCFDRWAAWSEGRWDQALGLPQTTLLARMAHLGIRMGISHSGNEPDINDEPLVVAKLMEEWESRERLAHSALMARHRRIANGTILSQVLDEHGKRKRFRDSDLALIIVGDGSDSGRRRFQRLCERGYVELRLRLRNTAPVKAHTPP